MNKTLWIVVLGIVLAGMAGCSGGGKYAEVKTLLDKQVAVMEDYVTSLEKAGSAKDVADAINRYAVASKDLMPRMKALSEKYPEMGQEKEPPAELKPLMEKLKDLGMRMGQASMKAFQYMSDPLVQAAQKNLMESARSGM